MTLSDLSSIGSFVSGIAVVVSLVFVGVQVLQNTRAMRSQIHQNFTDGWLEIGALVASNAKVFAVGIAADEKTFAAMPDPDKLCFMAIIFAFFKHYENMFLQHKEGFIRDEDWNAWTNHMFLYWHMPGVRLWWKVRREAFSPEFRHFLETSQQPAMPSQVDIFTQVSNSTSK